MITYVTGDLLGATQKVLIHGCNNHGIMGSGIARQIRARWPNVYEVYNLRYRAFGLDLGDIVPVATLDGKIVVNCITQNGFGRDGSRYVNYDAVEQCIIKINERVADWEVSEVALPRIGAGLGGGDWNIIEGIITKNAKSFMPIVYDFQVDL